MKFFEKMFQIIKGLIRFLFKLSGVLGKAVLIITAFMYPSSILIILPLWLFYLANRDDATSRQKQSQSPQP